MTGVKEMMAPLLSSGVLPAEAGHRTPCIRAGSDVHYARALSESGFWSALERSVGKAECKGEGDAPVVAMSTSSSSNSHDRVSDVLDRLARLLVEERAVTSPEAPQIKVLRSVPNSALRGFVRFFDARLRSANIGVRRCTSSSSEHTKRMTLDEVVACPDAFVRVALVLCLQYYFL